MDIEKSFLTKIYTIDVNWQEEMIKVVKKAIATNMCNLQTGL